MQLQTYVVLVFSWNSCQEREDTYFPPQKFPSFASREDVVPDVPTEIFSPVRCSGVQTRPARSVSSSFAAGVIQLPVRESVR